MGGPIVVLMWRVLRFCQPFFSSDTKQFMAMVMFCLNWSSVKSTCPTAVPKHRTFFSWNLMVCLSSSILSFTFSPSLMGRGCFPILTKTLPRILVSCFKIASEAIRTSYFLAHFLILVLSLLKALRPSASMVSIPRALASSKWTTEPITQTFILRWGLLGSLMDPWKRLSFSGSQSLRPICNQTVQTNFLCFLVVNIQVIDFFKNQVGILLMVVDENIQLIWNKAAHKGEFVETQRAQTRHPNKVPFLGSSRIWQ